MSAVVAEGVAHGRSEVSALRQVLIATGAMLLTACLVLPQLADVDGDVTVFLRIGTESASRPMVERDFSDPVLGSRWGHDGQQFYVLARVFPDLRDATEHVDRIHYRARRIGFVLLVAPFPSGAPTVWAMFTVNLLAIGAAAAAVARLAARAGASPLVGLAVGVTPAMVASLQGSLGDALAFALALWGVVFWRHRLWLAVALFALAALTRETTLVVPLACFLADRPRPRLALLVPFGVYAAWAVTLQVWIPKPDDATTGLVDDLRAQLVLPFDAWRQLGFGFDGVLVAAGLFVAGLGAAWVLRGRLPEVSWWLAFDSLLLASGTVGVVIEALNVSRVAPLVVPAVAIAVSARLRAGSTRPIVGSKANGRSVT